MTRRCHLLPVPFLRGPRAIARARFALGAIAIGAALATQAHAADHTVLQKDKIFALADTKKEVGSAPAEVKAKVGDSLTFVNDDTVAHNVFSTAEGHAFNLKIQKPGGRSSVTLDKEGNFEARCAIHPKMILRVTVTK